MLTTPALQASIQGPADRITFRTDAPSAALADAGAQLLEAYDAFSVARGPASALAALASEGWYVQALAQAPFLQMLSGTVDLRAMASPDATTWPVDPAGRAIGLVHFYAPIKPAWQDAVRARGVDILEYVPTDAFLVRAPAAALQGLRALPYVDWLGPDEAGWKLAPGAAVATGVQDVRIVVFPGEPTAAVEAWLAQNGVAPHASAAGQSGIVGAFGSGNFQWVRAQVPSDLLPSLAQLPYVEYVDPVESLHTDNYNTDWILQTNQSINFRYWGVGLNGTGQVIGIADTGLDYDNPQFRQNPGAITIGDIYNVTNPARRKVVRYLDMGVLTGELGWPGTGSTLPWDPYSMMDCAYNGAENGHGTAVASTVAGNASAISGDTNNGNALAAKIYMEDIGGLAPGSTCASGGESLTYVPQDYADLFGPPGLGYNDPLAPVRIQSDSWGSPGDAYDVQAWMVDAYAWSHPDFLMLFAAGNEGPNAMTIDSPATAKDAVAVGGVCNPDAASSACPGAQNDLASFSSRGPTVDGRLKPDIVATADGYSATSSGSPFDCPTYNAGNSACTLPDHGWAGTSYATPAAAAAAAIIRQYFTQGWYPSRSPVAADAFDPSAALLRAMLLASGAQVTGSGTSAAAWPNDNQGFGRVLLSNVLPLPGDPSDTEVVDNTAGLVTGQGMTYTFHVVGGAASAKFVLAWTDYPGTLGAAKALVNDLDLQVTAPDGTVYRGNNFGSFASGQSVPGGTFDSTNSEEAVLLKRPIPGDWTVQVVGADVPVGPQPFALVAAGSFDPTYGRLVLDRASYNETDTVHITLYDANAPSATVHVTSGLETVGENVVLTQAAVGAPWTGSIRTAFGQPVPDGILEVRDGDLITVTYQDTSPAHTAVATARVDATPPTVWGVAAGPVQATSADLHWSTDRPADTEVVYGTSPSALSGRANDSLLRTGHDILLTGLQADTLYYYDVLARDALGHVTRDSNGGRHYTFRTPPWGDVLLVIGDSTFPAARVASYAAALSALGWTWSTWFVADLGLPPLAVLQGRRAIIWQVGLEEYPTFNVSAQGLVKAYLDGGGRLLIFSHDTSWSLGSTNSPWYNASNLNWLRNVLKASFACDPSDIGRIVGMAGDPISGAFTSGVGYTPHRTGGADDEIAANSVGGPASVAWQDGLVTGCGGGPIGLRWVASANNGTSGVGAWGGTPSRLAYFAFEITSVDTNATDLRPDSIVRRQILDDALRWLVGISTTVLDRDHPSLSIGAPSGGTFTGPNLTVTWNATAYGQGIGLASFLLAYSRDGGQTWVNVTTLGGAVRTYDWSLAGLMNGNAYLLRIFGTDSGTPSLTGEAVTNGTFAINRTGGDSLGPVIWAGSLHVGPDPPGAAALATFNATADDTRAGDSPIAAAELFWSATAPVAANGTGLPMSAVDGSFDTPVENVTWSSPLAVAPGSTCAWVHAEDAAGNWGPFNVTCFVVLNVGPDVLPPAPAIPTSVALVNASADLRITWAKAWDDSLYGGTVAYRVWRATSVAGPFLPVSGNMTATGAASYAYTDPGKGASDPTNAFYEIETRDAANNTAMSVDRAAKAWMPVAAGLNLLGMPLEPAGLSLADLAAGVPWSEAFRYSACSGSFPWVRTTPTGNPAFRLHPGDGFWFNATSAGRLLDLGIVRGQTHLRLCAGWNLIALPGFRTTETVGSLQAATGADLVLGFDPADLFHTRILSGTDALAPGEGVWVHVPTAVTWSVAGW